MSAVTDQAGMQDLGANAGDFDDDEGGGLVSKIFPFMFLFSINTKNLWTDMIAKNCLLWLSNIWE